MVKNRKKLSRNLQGSANPKPKRSSKAEVSNKQKPHAKEKRSLDRRNRLEYECGKPNMPSRSELKKQFEEEEQESDEKIDGSTSVGSRTPKENSSSTSEITLTPGTIKRYADAVLEVLDGHEASLSVIPIKRFKKSDEPYIDNCTERPKVPESKTCNVFKGDNYGITGKTNAFNIDEDELKTPGINGGSYNVSKSKFNAQANEIASKLLSTKYDPIKSGSDSDDTVVYDLDTPENRFSPQPSTSNDREIILRNDQRFNSSFLARQKGFDYVADRVENVKETTVDNKDSSVNIKIPINSEQMNIQLKSNTHVKELLSNNCKSSLNSDFEHDIEIIEPPCETIEIDDNNWNTVDITKPYTSIKSELWSNNCKSSLNSGFEHNDIQIIERPCETIEIDDNNWNTDEINKPYTCTKSENNSDIVIEIADEICDKSIQKNINNSTKVVEGHKRFVNPTVIAEIDLATMYDEVFETKCGVDKYRLIESALSVEDKFMNRNVLNEQFASRIFQNNISKSTNSHQYHCNYVKKVKQITKQFFDNSENVGLFQKNNTNNTLSRNEKILPEFVLTNIGQSENISCQNVDSPCKSESSEKIPVNSLRFPSCPICLDDLCRVSMASTNCGHLFCMSCISTALKKKPKKCPTCRKKLTGAGYHQIYM